jgi:signal transduction histidine kinase
LEAVLNSAPEPILVFDDQMNLLLLNPAALQIPELVAIATPGKPVSQVLPNIELQKLVLRPIQEGTTTGEISLSNKRIYFVSVSQVHGNGEVMGRVCILRDITYYKNLDREKSDYVSNVSHDLRSPLTLLRGYITMIQMMGELNEQQQGFIKKMILSVESMTGVVEKLLDLGRLESGVGLVIGRVMPVLIIEEVVTAQAGDAAKKNIRIDTSKVPRHRIEMEADPALLSQALRNLIENAIKYTPIGGQVSIGLQEQADAILFEVRDTGIGIAPLDLPRVFEKFYRSSRREAYSQKGSGLGLAIVKSIAERQHGRVWVESQLGKGSVFFMELPIRQPRSSKN